MLTAQFSREPLVDRFSMETQIVHTPPPSLPGSFQRELEKLAFGVTGSAVSYEDTVELLNSIANEFIFRMTVKSAEAGKIHLTSLLMAIRKDRRKYARAAELIRVAREIADARKGPNVEKAGEGSAEEDQM